MDDDNSLSPENLAQDLLVETDLVRQKLEIAEEKVMQLELSLLHSRDFAIGAAAEMGEARAEAQKILPCISNLKDNLAMPIRMFKVI